MTRAPAAANARVFLRNADYFSTVPPAFLQDASSSVIT